MFLTFLHKKPAVKIHQLSSWLEISVTISDFHDVIVTAERMLVECLAVLEATQFVSN